MNMRERLIKVIKECKECEFNNEFEDIDLIKELEFDSVDVIHLVIALEDEFDFELEDDDLGLNTLGSFNKLLQLVEEKGN